MDPRFASDPMATKAALEDRLKSIAAQLLEGHRRQDHAFVIPYARQAGLAVEGQAPHHLFIKTIQVFHPDRLESLWARVVAARASSDAGATDELRRLLDYHAEPSRPVWRPVNPEPNTEPEEYGYEEFDEEADFDSDEGTFLWAVKRALFGNLNLYPDPADLARLEGELDLSDFDLYDLDGMEHCRGLTALNLSRNNLDNLYPLKDLVKLEALDLAENDLEDADWLGGLVNLRELDLSANDIDDVAFLDRLPRLKYVDLTGNPVRNKALISRLEARGVIVIF